MLSYNTFQELKSLLNRQLELISSNDKVVAAREEEVAAVRAKFSELQRNLDEAIKVCVPRSDWVANLGKKWSWSHFWRSSDGATIYTESHEIAHNHNFLELGTTKGSVGKFRSRYNLFIFAV